MTPSTPPGPLAQPRARLRTLIRTMRVRQWVKNVFVLPAPLFGASLDELSSYLLVGATFFAFCFLASGVYILNDVIDRDADRNHPLKRDRPIAAGVVSPRAAVLFGLILLAAGFATALSVNQSVALLAAFYLTNNLIYNAILKHKLVADVLSISLGFLCRVLAGAYAVELEPSSWLFICGMSLALFLGFCKRRSELVVVDQEAAHNTRTVLEKYSTETLNLLCGSTATLALITYMLFTVSEQTVRRHGTTDLIYTSPFVIYAVLRYLIKAVEGRAEEASVVLWDFGFLLAGLGWLASAAWILYFG